MPPDEFTRPSPISSIYDGLGSFPLILAAAFALAIITLFLIGFAKRRHRDTIDRCLLLLLVLAGLAFLTGTILFSSYAAMLHEMQSRAGMDPSALSADYFVMEWGRLLFCFVSVFALLTTGLLAFFRKAPCELASQKLLIIKTS